MNGIAPTIGGARPGYGLRVRLDGKARDMASADFACSCGRPSEDAIGFEAVQQLVVRAERHMRDECPNPDVRRAAALRNARRLQYASKRRK